MEETVPENEFSVYIKKGKRFDSRKNLNCVKVLLFSYMIKEGLIVSINDNYQGVYELRIRIDEENDFTKISKEFFVRFLTNWLFASIRVDKKECKETRGIVNCLHPSKTECVTVTMIYLDTVKSVNTYHEAIWYLRDCFNSWKKKAVQRETKRFKGYQEETVKIFIKSIEMCIHDYIEYFEDYMINSYEK